MTLRELAELTGGSVDPDQAEKPVFGVASAADAGPEDVTFLANKRYLAALRRTGAGAAFVPNDFGETVPCALIRVENPSVAFAMFVERVAPAPVRHEAGVHCRAEVHPAARLGAGVSIGPNVVIASGVQIGDRTLVEANCVIAEGAQIGEDCHLYPCVSLRERVVLGDRVTVHNGSVIGSDGYGYEFVDGSHVKIPQVGTVHVGNDVEIGANCTIDRARFGRTVVGEGSKIDNLVHIAHNVVIGKHALLVAQVGVSGSSRIGNYAILAGQVGVVGHIEIGDGAVVGAQSGVKDSIPAGQKWFGSPALPVRESHTLHALLKKLPRLVERLKALEQRGK